MRHLRSVTPLFLTLLFSYVFLLAQAKDMTNEERNQVESMLLRLASDVPKHFTIPICTASIGKKRSAWLASRSNRRSRLTWLT